MNPQLVNPGRPATGTDLSILSLSSLPEAIIFDCDGVVLDSRAAYKALSESLFDNLGLTRLSPEEERLSFALSLADTIHCFVPPLFQGAALDLTSDLTILDFKESIRPMPGLNSFLEYLRSLGLPLALNTNAGQEVHELLEYFDLLGFFDQVVTADDVVRPKPDPRGAGLILAQWGISPEGVVFIGDSIVDELTARALGTSFWAFDNPGLKADLHLTDFSYPWAWSDWTDPLAGLLPSGPVQNPTPFSLDKGPPGVG